MIPGTFSLNLSHLTIAKKDPPCWWFVESHPLPHDRSAFLFTAADALNLFQTPQSLSDSITTFLRLSPLTKT